MEKELPLSLKNLEKKEYKMSSIVETPLAEENLGLVHLCANRFRNRGIEYDDLYGAGCIV